MRDITLTNTTRQLKDIIGRTVTFIILHQLSTTSSQFTQCTNFVFRCALKRIWQHALCWYGRINMFRMTTVNASAWTNIPQNCLHRPGLGMELLSSTVPLSIIFHHFFQLWFCATDYATHQHIWNRLPSDVISVGCSLFLLFGDCSNVFCFNNPTRTLAH